MALTLTTSMCSSFKKELLLEHTTLQRQEILLKLACLKTKPVQQELLVQQAPVIQM